MVALLAAVALVLLIACANVANMVLARSTARRRELVIRSAIGASRWIVARGVLIETLLLSIAGAVFGVLVAWWTVHATTAFLPPNLPRASAIAVNGRVLLAAATAAVTTAAVFGLVPAWKLSRQDCQRARAILGRDESRVFRKPCEDGLDRDGDRYQCGARHGRRTLPRQL